MNAKRRIFPGLICLALMVAGPGLFGQSVPNRGRIPTGRQVPAMPRVQNEGRDSWVVLGGGPNGAMLGYSRLFSKMFTTVHAGYQANESFGGLNAGFTLGLPIATGRVFAAFAAGPGFLAGIFEDPDTIKGRFVLDADLQVLFRISPILDIGLYAVVATDFRTAYPCLCFCVALGRS